MKKVLFVLIALASFDLSAGDWSGWGEVKEMYVYPVRNGVYIKHDNMINPDSCASSSYYILSKTNQMFDESYSLLLAGHSAKKNITLFVSGCDGTYPKIDMVISKN